MISASRNSSCNSLSPLTNAAIIALASFPMAPTETQAWVPTSFSTPFSQRASLFPSSSSSSSSRLSAHRLQEITGEVLGEKYLLCKDSIGESTSGKSHLFRAFRKCPDSGRPKGDPVIIKVSNNHDALQRESTAYDRLAETEKFVALKDYIEPGEDDMECSILEDDKGALVMECGSQGDLKSQVDQQGGLRGRELQQTARAAVECLRAMHERGYVWTELKSENLVRLECGTVKGIDVESAVPLHETPIDYSPKQCPPEFAVHFLCGNEPSMNMEYNFDIWSTGMLLYELATGGHYFADREHCHVTVCMELKNTDGIELDAVTDPLLRDLIGRCLHLDPAQRPAVQDVLEHPYFAQQLS